MERKQDGFVPLGDVVARWRVTRRSSHDARRATGRGTTSPVSTRSTSSLTRARRTPISALWRE